MDSFPPSIERALFKKSRSTIEAVTALSEGVGRFALQEGFSALVSILYDTLQLLQALRSDSWSERGAKGSEIELSLLDDLQLLHGFRGPLQA